MLLKKIEGRHINPNQIVEVGSSIFDARAEGEWGDETLTIYYRVFIYLSDGRQISTEVKTIELKTKYILEEFVRERDYGLFEDIMRDAVHDYIQNNIENER